MAAPSGGHEDGLTALSGMMEMVHISSVHTWLYPPVRPRAAHEVRVSTWYTPRVISTPAEIPPRTGVPALRFSHDAPAPTLALGRPTLRSSLCPAVLPPIPRAVGHVAAALSPGTLPTPTCLFQGGEVLETLQVSGQQDTEDRNLRGRETLTPGGVGGQGRCCPQAQMGRPPGPAPRRVTAWPSLPADTTSPPRRRTERRNWLSTALEVGGCLHSHSGNPRRPALQTRQRR